MPGADSSAVLAYFIALNKETNRTRLHFRLSDGLVEFLGFFHAIKWVICYYLMQLKIYNIVEMVEKESFLEYFMQLTNSFY